MCLTVRMFERMLKKTNFRKREGGVYKRVWGLEEEKLFMERRREGGREGGEDGNSALLET